MELALSFDSVAETYRRARTGYPREIYERARQVAGLGPASRILEVGAGPGLATQEILESFGCRLDVVEPGAEFCRLLSERYGDNPLVTIMNARFEDVRPGIRYDAVFSATAFHWMDPELKYRHARNLLAPGGCLVTYWNNYELADPALRDEVRNVYRRHFPDQDQTIPEVQRRNNKIRVRRQELEHSGVFAWTESGVVTHTQTFSVERFVDLLRSFSENIVLAPSVLEPFLVAFTGVLRAHAPHVDVEIVCDWSLAGAEAATQS